jgi:hypothetical protein
MTMRLSREPDKSELLSMAIKMMIINDMAMFQANANGPDARSYPLGDIVDFAEACPSFCKCASDLVHKNCAS